MPFWVIEQNKEGGAMWHISNTFSQNRILFLRDLSFSFSGLRLLGIGRNQYIDLMNQCRSSKVCILFSPFDLLLASYLEVDIKTNMFIVLSTCTLPSQGFFCFFFCNLKGMFSDFQFFGLVSYEAAHKDSLFWQVTVGSL